MKLKSFTIFFLVFSILASGISFSPKLAQADCSDAFRINTINGTDANNSPQITVTPGQSFNINWNAVSYDNTQASGMDSGYQVRLYPSGGTFDGGSDGYNANYAYDSWTSGTTPNNVPDDGSNSPWGVSFVPSGSHAITNGSDPYYGTLVNGQDYTYVVVSRFYSPSCSVQTFARTLTVHVRTGQGPSLSACYVNSFTADTPVANSTTTTLRYNITVQGTDPYDWNITGASSSPATGTIAGATPPATNTVSGTTTTGILTYPNTYTYTLTCGGSSLPTSVVPQAPSGNSGANPPTVNISASPASMTSPSNSTTLSWTTGNSPSSCTASGNWSGGKSASGGSQNITGLSSGVYNYSITCNNADGSATDSVSVSVDSAPTSCFDNSDVSFVTDLPNGNLNPGQTYNFTVKSKNTGSSWWYHGSVYQLLQKSTLNISPTYGHLNNSIHTQDYDQWNFTLTAPTSPGFYNLNMQMIHKLWLGSGYERDDGTDCGSVSQDSYFGNTLSRSFNVVSTVVVPPPTNLISSCSANNATMSWTLPSGYTQSYVRVMDNTTGTYAVQIPETVSDTGPAVSFTGISGHNYSWWVHTRATDGTSSEPPVYGTNFTCSSNISPTVNAGPDQAINLPTTSVTMAGSASDSDGTIASKSWSFISGPATPTITTPSSYTTTITGLSTAGTYVFRLTATDNQGATTTDNMNVLVSPAGVMSGSLSGPDCIISAGASSCSTTLTFSVQSPEAALGSAVTSDTNNSGAASPNFAITPPVTTGTVDSGTKTVTIPYPSRKFFLFNNSKSLVPTSPSGTGIVVTASCVSGTSYNTGTNTCIALNIPPTVNAGPDQAINLPTTSVTMAGSASDSDGSVASKTWSFISGPATPTITTPSSYTTTITGLSTAGTYVFRLTATDNQGATTTDNMNVLVSPAGVMSGSLSGPASCTIGQGSGTCPVILSWSITNPEGTPTAITANGMSNINVTGSSGSQSVTVPNGGRTFFLFNNSKSLVPTSPSGTGIVVAASCVSGTSYNNGTSTCLSGNTSPTANAGIDQTITLPTSTITMSGSASDSDGTVSSTAWSKLSGPAGGSITTPSSPTTTVTSLSTAGTYTFRLTATDNQGGTGFDDMIVTVNAATGLTMTGDMYPSFSYCSGNPPFQNSVCLPNGSWVDSNHPSAPLAYTCAIPSGASTCNVKIDWRVNNVEGIPTTITAIGMTDISVSTSLTPTLLQNGTVDVPMPNGARTIFLKNNNKSLVPTVSSPNGTGLALSGSCVSGTTWNATVSKCLTNGTTPPILSNVTISDPLIHADGTTHYDIKVIATDSGGGSKINYEYAYINWLGSNSANPRGFLTWHTNTSVWSGEKDRKTCTGGGIAAIQSSVASGNNNSGHQYLTLSSCNTAISGPGNNTRTTTFDVIFDPLFLTNGPLTNNDISGYTANTDGNQQTWTNFDINFGVYVPPPLPTGWIKCGAPGSSQNITSCTIGTGLSANVTWLTGNTSSCSVSSSGVPISGWTGTQELVGKSTGNLNANKIYTLTCNGLDGSTYNSSVTVNVAFLPDLVADIAVPTSATVNSAVTFSSVISNEGTAATGASFSNFFQVADRGVDPSTNAPFSGATISPLAATTMPALTVGDTDLTIKSHTFSSPGTYSVRACTDLPADAIFESDETNNCGLWVDVDVSSLTEPTDGGWSIWTPAQSVQCEFTGTQNRTCNNPSPRNGGADCSLLDGGNSSRTYSTPACTLPNLTAGAVSPTSAAVGSAVSFSSTIYNAGTTGTGASFTNFFQVKDPSGAITDLTAGANMPALGGNAISPTIKSYTFSLPAGTYQMRACADKSSAGDSGDIAESNENDNCGPWTNVAVTAGPGVTLTTGTTVVQGGNINVSWANILAPSSTDEILLYSSSGVADSGYLDWKYVKSSSGTCTRTPTGAIAAGTCAFTIPLTATPGAAYQFRLFSNGTWTKLATSNSFTVTAGNITLTTSSTFVFPGDSVNVSWANIPAPSSYTGDWIGFYPSSGTSDSSFIDYVFVRPTYGACSVSQTGASSSGSCSYTIPLSASPKTTYEFRLFSNSTYFRLATSSSFTVSNTGNSTMTGTLTAPSPACLIQLGQSTCSATLSWGIQFPEGNTTAITSSVTNGLPAINATVSNSTSPNSQSGTQAVTLSFPNRTFYLYNNAKSLVPASTGSGIVATPVCAANTVWDGTICKGSTGVPIVVFELPASGATVSGLIPIKGYAVANSLTTMKRVEFLTSTGTVETLRASSDATSSKYLAGFYSIVRPDITQYYTNNIGFLHPNFNTALLSDGTHNIIIKAYDNAGNMTTVTTPVTVSNSNPFPILSVGSINTQNVASSETNSNVAWYTKAFNNSVVAVGDIFAKVAYALGQPSAGQPLQLSTPITNSGVATSTTFTNKYFIDINNDNPTAQPGSSTGWDLTFPITTSGVGANTTVNSATVIRNNSFSPPGLTGLPQGTHGIVFCADWNGNVSDPAQNISDRCTNKTISNVGPAGGTMVGTLTPSVQSCVIPLGQSNCNINFTWHVTNPAVVGGTAVTINTETDSGVTVGTGDDQTNISLSVKYNSETFYLYNNAVELGTVGGVTVASSCGANVWDGDKCVPPATLFMDLRVNGGDYKTSQAALRVQPGADLYFTWNSNGNSTLACFATGGVTTGGWPQANAAMIKNWGDFTNLDRWKETGFHVVAPSTPGPYAYSAKCQHDPAFGMNKADNFISYIINTAYASFISDTDSVNLQVLIPSTNGTLTPEFPSCVISTGGSTCSVNFSWNTVNPIDISVVTKDPDIFLATGNAGSDIPFIVKYPNDTYHLSNNNLYLDTKKVNAVCQLDAGWDGTKCVNLTLGPDAPAGTIKCNGLSTPTCTIPSGGSASITWSTQNTDSCNIAGTSWGPGTSGSANTGSLSANRTYNMSCHGLDGSTFNTSVTVNVLSFGWIKCNGSSIFCNIDYNTAATISWKSFNTDSCIVSPTGQTGVENPIGFSTGNLTASTVYNLTCHGLDDSIYNSLVVVNVIPPGGSAGIFSLTANPTGIFSGGLSTLTWSGEGCTSAVGTNFNTGGACSGTIFVNPTSTTTYTVVFDGNTTRTATISVTKKQPSYIEP